MVRPMVHETVCRTLLQRTRATFADYTVNAYEGCAFGCAFCYVPVQRERRGQPAGPGWGRWVRAKVNAPDRLREELARLAGRSHIAIGTAADSWQPAERDYQIARGILLALAPTRHRVSIVTRSPLLMRDIDLLQRMADVTVSVSITSFRDAERRALEPSAPTIPARIRLIERLVAAGIRTDIFCAPYIPQLYRSDADIDLLAATAERLGVRRVICDPLRHAEALAALPVAPAAPTDPGVARVVRACARHGVPCNV